MHVPQAMWADPPHNYWQIVMTHEAGHAVAALAIYGVSADIFIKARRNVSEPLGASYRISPTDTWSDEANAIGAVIVLAAGAKAEAICLGITESAGFVGDRGKINSIRAHWERKCTDEFQNSPGLPENVIKEVRAGNPRRRAKLREITDEIESDFARTREIIGKNRKALEIIAAEAYSRVQSLGGDQNLSEGEILLPAKRIDEIWLEECGSR